MIHRLIRDQARTGFVATGAFLVAFPVSLFEFMCTGQTYLPTIVLIFSQNVLKQRAALFMVVYNLLFILPLVLITVIAYLGVTSDHGHVAQEECGASKGGHGRPLCCPRGVPHRAGTDSVWGDTMRRSTSYG